jgi:hypothetical protein
MLTYRALESNSEAIACDVESVISGTKPGFSNPVGGAACAIPANMPETTIVLLPFEKSELEDFAAWRAGMADLAELQGKAASLGCPKNPNPGISARTGTSTSSLSTFLSMTPAGPPLAMAQSVFGLLESEETSTSVSGNIKDLAFVNNVARQLKSLHIFVLLPSSFDPESFAVEDETVSPFLASKKRTLLARGCLSKLKPDEDHDPADIQQAISDIDNYMAGIGGNKPTKTTNGGSTSNSGSSISGQSNASGGPAESAGSVNKNSGNPGAGTAASALSAKLIEDYMTAFSGEQPAKTSTGGSATNSGSANSGGQNGSKNLGASTGPVGQGAETGPGGTRANAPNPLSAILRADGLAQKLGFRFSAETGRLSEPENGHYILMVKALESGGSVTGTTNILGTRLRYSGGSVGTYALFAADGDLACSGNVYDYGGSLPAKHFERDLRNVHFDPSQQVIFHTGGCPLLGSAAPAVPPSNPIH